MSASDTDLERQARRHRPALIGIAAALGLAGLLFLGYVTLLSERGDTPQGAETQIDGGYGTEISQ